MVTTAAGPDLLSARSGRRERLPTLVMVGWQFWNPLEYSPPANPAIKEDVE